MWSHSERTVLPHIKGRLLDNLGDLIHGQGILLQSAAGNLDFQFKATALFHIDLAKEVPAGAGLGGGSGNAATMLWAANQLCG